VNLDLIPSEEELDPPRAPLDWTMDLELGEGSGYVGVVKRSGVVMCRILLASKFASESDARSALANKARGWIFDYLARSVADSDSVEGAAREQEPSGWKGEGPTPCE
jgi:hypothetical protein